MATEEEVKELDKKCEEAEIKKKALISVQEDKTDKAQLFRKITKLRNIINVPKKHYNKYGDFYYRKISDILEALSPLEEEMGLFSDARQYDFIAKDGKRHIRVEITVYDLDTGACYVAGTAELEFSAERPKMSSEQRDGATISYCLKRAYESYLHLSDDETASDPDDPKQQEEKQKGKKQTKEPPKANNKLSDTELQELQIWIETNGLSEDFIIESFNVKALSEIPKAKIGAMTDEKNLEIIQKNYETWKGNKGNE